MMEEEDGKQKTAFVQTNYTLQNNLGCVPVARAWTQSVHNRIACFCQFFPDFCTFLFLEI